ncbi:hypothetical protein THASP1DRAFT_24008 [Thamnocephalis sphaerospora]|uniref:Uncharacterized protein n=1 Tax=Thamnocephalis sphaerospora TaxID=78915 RepID=A0A4P9XPJ7_9FUNG|nr:hypothetical protein THASP1DRAFT_24008 [Thamnocephalis sphaerospora]|eukprot:RKP07916.1 hypothetical protein THASP1DRAFT_24008 [Thamnocephalis sphaerospora]
MDVLASLRSFQELSDVELLAQPSMPACLSWSDDNQLLVVTRAALCVLTANENRSVVGQADFSVAKIMRDTSEDAAGATAIRRRPGKKSADACQSLSLKAPSPMGFRSPSFSSNLKMRLQAMNILPHSRRQQRCIERDRAIVKTRIPSTDTHRRASLMVYAYLATAGADGEQRCQSAHAKMTDGDEEEGEANGTKDNSTQPQHNRMIQHRIEPRFYGLAVSANGMYVATVYYRLLAFCGSKMGQQMPNVCPSSWNVYSQPQYSYRFWDLFDNVYHTSGDTCDQSRTFTRAAAEALQRVDGHAQRCRSMDGFWAPDCVATRDRFYLVDYLHRAGFLAAASALDDAGYNRSSTRQAAIVQTVHLLGQAITEYLDCRQTSLSPVRYVLYLCGDITDASEQPHRRQVC